ncbi:hypothetical protein LshimejAT787_1300820 [Lyophyllum shimeji]|uniref:Uncharacterized protein n=1 Tax=Lyophyllum shimeji TaxID=47721 RepID=A0A9P3UUI1_LYOSH|nr:hypothetical protein LshimejAT787_1300820 [Lyophyllum shimeji]
MSNQASDPRPIRPLPARAQNSFSFANTENAHIIRYALNDLSAEDLHSQLSKAIKNLHPSQLYNLLDVLKTAGIVAYKHEAAAKDTQRRHCVRCHKSYLERYNTLQACKIAHCRPDVIETPAPVVGGFHGSTTVHIRSTKPGTSASTVGATRGETPPAMKDRIEQMVVDLVYPCCGLRTKPGQKPDRDCFLGRHTTTAENVHYNPANVWPCERVGCGRPPARATTAAPVGADTPAQTDVTQA